MAAIAYPDLLPYPQSPYPSDHGAPLAPVVQLRPASRRLPQGVYVRRRLVAAGAALLMITSLFVVVIRVEALLGESHPAAVAGSSGPATVVADLGSLAGSPIPANAVYVVRPGDSLWRVARQLRPDSDPRPFVDRLAQLNGGAPLVVGQHLKLS